MKATTTCPKCHSKKIVLVPGKSVQAQKHLSYGRWGSKKVKMDTYICSRCGFSERYANLSDKFLSWAKGNLIETPEEDNDFV